MIDLDTCFMRDFEEQEPRGDDGWANRIVWIYARIINYCFGGQKHTSNDYWVTLSAQMFQWKSLLPNSFEPLFQKNPDDDDDGFPAIWFLCEWHGEFRPSHWQLCPEQNERLDTDLDGHESLLCNRFIWHKSC